MSKDKYSISLVYQRQNPTSRESALRVIILDSNNENEALGEAINHFSDEFENWSLLLKTVIKIEP